MSPVPGFSSAFLAVLVPVALCGGFIGGFTGFGGPLFVLPVMAIFEPAEIAAASVLCMDVVANIQLLPAARSHWSARALLPLLVGTAMGLPFGTQVLVSFDPVVMRRVIVAVVLLAAASLLAGWRYRRPINLRGYGAIGLVGAIGARMHDRVSERAARRGTLLCIILAAILSLAV